MFNVPGPNNKGRGGSAQERQNANAKKHPERYGRPNTGPGVTTAQRQGAVPPVPASTLPGGVPAATTNTAQMDPNLSRQLARYEQRFTEDPTKRAIQASTLGIADSAALSAADARGMMSRRGTLGTGAGDTFLQRHVFQPAQRQAAGAAAGIAMQREQDLDRLVVGGTALAAAPGQQSIQERNLGLNQQGQAFNQNFAVGQAEWQRQFDAQQAQQRADDEAARRLTGLYQPYLSGGVVPPGVPIPGTPVRNPYAGSSGVHVG